jgi:hypothetical protein
MKKLLIISLIFIAHLSNAQQIDLSEARPSEEMVDYEGKKASGYTIEIASNKDLVESTMREQLKKMKVKVKEDGDFWEVKNTVFPKVRKEAVDGYMKIEKKSNKEKEVSLVTLILTEPGIEPGAEESVINDAKGGKSDVDEYGAFNLLIKLNGFSAMNNIDLKIALQEEEVRELEKKQKDLVEDGEDLEKDLEKTQDAIKENKKEQAEQLEELQKQKELLMQIRAKK